MPTVLLFNSIVMEIYTEGSTNTSGTLYDECRNQLIQTVYMGPLPPNPDGTYIGDDNGNGNGNFKITAHLKAMQFYYIAVFHSTGGYGDYTLKFKFVKDYCNDLVNAQYSVVYWFNDDQSNPPYPSSIIHPDYQVRNKHKVFIGDYAKSEYLVRIIDDQFEIKSELQKALENPVVDDVLSILVSIGCELIPYVGSYLNYAIDVGLMMYDCMDLIDTNNRNTYLECATILDNEEIGTALYIEGIKNTYYTTDKLLVDSIHYSVNSGRYYGVSYNRGNFTLVKLR